MNHIPADYIEMWSQPTGAAGRPGVIGATGVRGVIGETGPQGQTGPRGIPGQIGTIGFPGLPGLTGVRGIIGPRGVTGIPGRPGTRGATGLVGIVGQTGISMPGVTGARGSTGLRGDTGPQGVTGLSGLGAPGLFGSTGLQGSTGPVAQGDTGVQGQTGAGMLTYTNPAATPVALGGIPASSTFDNVPLVDMFTELLYPYQYPSFSSFSLNYNILEVGVATATVQFTWNCTNVSNIQAASLTITNPSNAVLLSGLNYNSSPQSVSSVTHLNSPGSLSWHIAGQNSLGQGFGANAVVAWRYRAFWGGTTVLDPADPTVLVNNPLSTGFAGSYVFAAAPLSYQTFAWPVSFGVPNAFKDADTGFEMGMQVGYQVSITNGSGIITIYNVFQSAFFTSSAITVVVN